MLSLSYQRRVASQRQRERAQEAQDLHPSLSPGPSVNGHERETLLTPPRNGLQFDDPGDVLNRLQPAALPGPLDQDQDQVIEEAGRQDLLTPALNLRQEEELTNQQQAVDAPADSKSLPFRFASALSLRQKQTKFIVLQHQQQKSYGRHRNGSLSRRKKRYSVSKNCEFIRKLIRERKRELEENQRQHELEQEVLALSEVIARLERNQTLAVSRSTTFRMNRSAAAVDLLQEYFRHFERGYDPTDGTRTQSDSRALEFANAVMDPQMVCREYRGMDKLLSQWEKYTKYHSGLEFVLKSVVLVEEEEDLVSIRGMGEMRLRISMDTLRYLYPPILEDPDNNELVASLIGKVYVMPIDKVFHFNNHGKVIAHESKAHLVSGLFELLHDPSAAMRLINASVLTEDGHWKTVHEPTEVQETMNELRKLML